MNSRILEEVHETARGILDAGVIDEKRMEEYDALCLPRVPEYSARDIKKIRSLYSLNQKQLAAIMNISDSTVQKWERGAKKPAGSSRKRLYIQEKKGISAFR